MPQNEHIELHQKRYGRRLDYEERKRKRAAREVHERSDKAKKTKGLKAKLLNKERRAEKIQMKKTIKMYGALLKHTADIMRDFQYFLFAKCFFIERIMKCGKSCCCKHSKKYLSTDATPLAAKVLYSQVLYGYWRHEEKLNKQKEAKPVPDGAIPAYLMDREGQSRAKAMNNMIKQKRKEKAGKWSVPLPKVRGIDEAEVMKVIFLTHVHMLWRTAIIPELAYIYPALFREYCHWWFLYLLLYITFAPYRLSELVNQNARPGSAWLRNTHLLEKDLRGNRPNSNVLSARLDCVVRKLTLHIPN